MLTALAIRRAGQASSIVLEPGRLSPEDVVARIPLARLIAFVVDVDATVASYLSGSHTERCAIEYVKEALERVRGEAS